MVANGQADVLVGNVAAVDIELKQRYAGVLKILGTVGESDSFGFAVRPDLAPLAGLDRSRVAGYAAGRKATHPPEVGDRQCGRARRLERDGGASAAGADRHRRGAG